MCILIYVTMLRHLISIKAIGRMNLSLKRVNNLLSSQL